MSKIYCPYCGSHERDPIDINEPEENLEWKCESCGKNFRVDAEAEIVFYSYAEEKYLDRARWGLANSEEWYEKNKDSLADNPRGLANVVRQLTSRKAQVAKAEERCKENEK
ncbi:MAG: hypothetical protein ACOX2M_04000 [Fastidiosipilaceae bacterium]|jgi:transcription elongation factor Elf1